uniref:ATP-dependent (S)-NAD(P)H-hydrate dehydratase n=1 Tax=Toxocara canis TaxID=6265 RepID=A0A183TXD1_TOXCA
LQVPRISSGPDLHHVILGSEGTLGVITEVTIKIFPLPEVKKYGSFVFPTFGHGVDFFREVAKQQCQPASLRLMDNEQFMMGQALKSEVKSFWESLSTKLAKIYLTKWKGFKIEEMVAATIVYEGSAEEVGVQEKKLALIADKYGGLPGGEESGKYGYRLTFAIAYLRDLGMDYSVMGESFETSVPWDRVKTLCHNVKQVIRREAKASGITRPILVSCRVTQVYDSGACVYFYFGFNYRDVHEPLEVYDKIETAARDEILACGGSISHHHGVGKLRKQWMPRTIGEVGISVLKAIKNELDPQVGIGIGRLACPSIRAARGVSENEHQSFSRARHLDMGTQLCRVCVTIHLKMPLLPPQCRFASRAVTSSEVLICSKLLPPLSESLRKGECGRIGVFGGSSLYTGAPYFAAMTSLKVASFLRYTGCDMVHVFCPPDAAPIIKSYSPELMVHPSYDRNALKESLHRIDALILGPGLGREEHVMPVVEHVIEAAKEKQLPIVIDADALFLLASNLSLVKGCSNAILTPNYPEFTRLYEHAFEGSQLNVEKRTSGEAAKQLAKHLGCTVLQKGAVDIITDGTQLGFGKTIGSPRRCGGQGDLLNGALAVFLFWALKKDEPSPTIAAALAASQLIRTAAREAFEEHGRSMTATDMLDHLPALISSAEMKSF